MNPPDDNPSFSQPDDQDAPNNLSEQEQTSQASGQEYQAQVRAQEQQPSEEQISRSHSPSEQIPLTYPAQSERTTMQMQPYQPPVANYQHGTTAPLAPPPHGAPTGPMWTYPPRPEQYQPYGGQSNSAQTYPGNQMPPFAQSTSPVQPVQHRNRRSGLRTGAIIALTIVLLAVFGTGLFAGWQFGRSSAATNSGNPFQSGNNSTVTIPQLTSNNQDAVREAIVSKVQAAIVQVDVLTSTQHALGSGDIIDGRGYIITNDHVVEGASSIQVTLSDNATFTAKLVGTDTADDLAMIKITPPASGLTVINFADSSQLKVGQGVLAIGSPLGNADTVTSGIVSALNRNVSESDSGPTLPDAIQTDAPINPGNSGGALVDMQGNLIGIPTLNAVNTETNTPANGLGFAIPSNRIKFIAQQLITDGQVTHTGRAILGVKVTSVTSDIASQAHLSVQSGALIVDVTSGSPASSAGLQANDVIVQVDGTTIQNTDELSSTLLTHSPGQTVSVKIYRGTQQMTVNVTLGELPAN